MLPPTTWRKSSFSTAGNQCVEVATTSGSVLVRDSKHPDAGYVTLTGNQVGALVDAAGSGALDHMV